VNTSESSLKDK